VLDDGIHTYEKLNESTNNILDHVLDKVPCLKLHINTAKQLDLKTNIGMHKLS
jgi:hypothetical protein